MSTITLNENMVLVELPARDDLQTIATHEGFGSVEEWVAYAILSHAQWIAIRDKMEQTATNITVVKLGLGSAA